MYNSVNNNIGLYCMRKFIALFLALVMTSINGAFAFSEVYYLKNTTPAVIQPSVLNAFYSQDFQVIDQKNPYYAKSTKDAQDYAVVILQQSGNNMFYYYQSNDNKKINKYILKAIKRADIEYEQSFNSNIISTFDDIANRTIQSAGTSAQNKYIFNDNEPAYSSSYSSTTSTVKQNSNTYKGYVANVESGTKIKIYLQGAINTATAVEGDRVIAVLTDNLTHNGYVVAPQGSLVYGILTKARHASYGSRNGRVVIDFNQLVTPEGKTFNIETEKIDFTVTNEGKVGRVASNVAVGAIVGALGGLIVGAISHNPGVATAIGAGVGAGGALIGGAAERGVDAEIPSFTEMEITLTKPFNTTVSY